MLLKCCVFHSFKVKNMGMIAKNAELRPIKICGISHENFSKTNGKRVGIAFLSNLQLISRFLEFLQGQGERGENEA